MSDSRQLRKIHPNPAREQPPRRGINPVLDSYRAIVACRLGPLIFLILALAFLASCGKPVRGTVRTESGAPIKGADVRIEGTDHKAETDKSGSFKLKYDPGTFVLVVAAYGYIPYKREVVIPDKSGLELAPIVLKRVPPAQLHSGPGDFLFLVFVLAIALLAGVPFLKWVFGDQERPKQAAATRVRAESRPKPKPRPQQEASRTHSADPGQPSRTEKVISEIESTKQQSSAAESTDDQEEEGGWRCPNCGSTTGTPYGHPFCTECF